MGKPFATELSRLSESVDWVNTQSLADVSGLLPQPEQTLIAVGSGGSQSAAVYAALCHRARGGLAFATTPLDLMALTETAKPHAVLFVSARGANKDILAAVDCAIKSEAHSIHAVCSRIGSPLGTRITNYARGSLVELDLPAGKDGFLATNSLIASMVALYRNYAAVSPEEVLSQCVDPILLVPPPPSSSDLLSRSEWLVVHAGWGTPAAADLESKLSESALRTVQLCDLRNFAHGRHLWLANRGARSAVVFVTDADHEGLVEQTSSLLPSTVARQTLSATCAGPAAAIALMSQVFWLVNQVGEYDGVDPGKPHVPAFGRQIYHLGPQRARSNRRTYTVNELAQFGAARKLRLPPTRSVDEPAIQAGVRFFTKIAAARFAALVLDYDGTLVEPSARYQGPSEQVANRLNGLLERGLRLGIATGRGKSVRTQLRQIIHRCYWEQILVGYYNGGEVIRLDADSVPGCQDSLHPTIERVKERLESDTYVMHRVAVEVRPRQITLTPTEGSQWTTVKRYLHEMLASLEPLHTRAVESGHSLDVVPHDISKKVVIRGLQGDGTSTAVLCIGDAGAWPGNDFDLLAVPHSLSVDAVSSDWASCWNFLPPGVLGVPGTLKYLSAVRDTNGEFKMDLLAR